MCLPLMIFRNTPIGVVRYGSGQVTYVEPCSAAYAVFGELQVLSIEITVELPSGQSTVGLSEIYILGK